MIEISTTTDLDTLLARVPGLRRMRSLDADLLRVLLDRKRGECSWCGTLVQSGRRTWCSDNCVDAFKLRCDAGRQMRFVEARDGGICQLCQRDTIAAERDNKILFNRRHQLLDGPDRIEVDRQLHLAGYARGSWREVDHIVPVSEYGGLLGPQNLRLICGSCHLAETNRLAKRRR